MSSLLQSFQSKEALPMSQPAEETAGGGLGVRKRLSSLSLRINMRARSACQQPILSFYSTSNTSSSSWAFRRSKSLSSLSAGMGEYAGSSIRKWWEWGLGWIMSKKPTFAQDLEMNEEEKAVLGCHSRGSLRHVFYKVRSELRRFVRSDNNVGLPQTFRYDSFNYSKNFDDGKAMTN
ncbi:uncharacterized protein [Nicotiana tomentosiformis]|uniref:Uncharacterized protein n=1 Tax=Nicotiana tabacum TaxID=4097 RepID=A0A1S3ZRB7_TOBAC|nr:uncharacterized protein LOC104086387 [Nicotiana tomentosiformis]XP_016466902.1 PREDICTED: uncharacterized protein LOC107789581 [Nicotiana tabacum]